MVRLLLIPVFIALTITGHAQVSFGGVPIGARAGDLGLPDAPLVMMHEVDAAALMLEDLEREASGIKGPWRFGSNHATDLTLENSGAWHAFTNGDRLWRIAIECPGAYTINFEFNTYVVPSGARVFVWNEAGDHLGAFTAASAPGRTELGVTQLPGDRITIEYHEPAAVTGQGRLRIGQVTHGYRDLYKKLRDLGDSGPCNNNVICPEGDDWRDQIASVAMITAGGGGLCTGQLINNCANDGTPYFLTANHCTPGGVDTWIFRFNWDSPTCTPTTNGPTSQTVSGSTLLVNSTASDVALLQLNSTPPASYNVYYGGWDASGAEPSSEVCISHPSGDVKKITFNNDPALQTPWGTPVAECWRIPAWDDGTTEGGSSGGALWDQDHRIIGQLYGGIASCGNNIDDYFGRFNVSYPLLDDWLGACGPALDGYDPNYVPVPLDAAVHTISNVQPSYCNENVIDPLVTIKNLGTTTLTSLTLLYNIDGGPNATLPWTGSLPTGSTASVGLGAIPVTSGDHILTVTCIDPNGGTDANATNDQKTRAFVVTHPAQFITLEIHLDEWPQETTWQLATSGGGVVASGGPYGSLPDMDTVLVELCVGNGCYDLTVFDSAEDGICCMYGEGDFNVHDPFGLVYVTNNGQFNASVTESFCVTNTGIGGSHDEIAMQPWPNPADDQIHLPVPATNEVVQVRIIDASGREIRRIEHAGRSPVIVKTSDLSDGLYLAEVVINSMRTVQRFAVKH